MRLRIGLVGLGEAWDKRHRPALRAMTDRFEVRAVCDPVAHRAELAAGQFGASVVEGYHALLAREDLDAVLLLSGEWFGTLPILAACGASKAVFLGSGLDMPLEEASRIRREVQRSGIAFLAEFPRRHSPATLRLKELIATRLGRPKLLFCHHRLPVLDAGEPGARCRGCRTTGQELVELIDWSSYIVGESPRWVTGIMGRPGKGPFEDDYQMLSLDFSEGDEPGAGPLAQISCGRYIPQRWSEAITYRPLAALQVRCERGIAFVDLPAGVVWFDEAGRHQESLESERPVGEQLLMQFYRAVTSLVSKTCDLEDVYRAIRVAEEARRSHAEGRRVELTEG